MKMYEVKEGVDRGLSSISNGFNKASELFWNIDIELLFFIPIGIIVVWVLWKISSENTDHLEWR